jgi:hypothetical protein
MQKSITVAEYMKTAKGLQVLVFAFPVVAKIFDHHAGVPFPPMGDDATTWRFFAAAIIGSSVLLPYLLLPRKRRRWIICCLFALFVLSSAVYLKLEGEYVLSIPHPDGTRVYVTRGTTRNPELKEPYASMKDYDLICHSGQSDARLERAYAKESLQSNRLKLFWSYVLSLVLLELTLGSAAKSG